MTSEPFSCGDTMAKPSVYIETTIVSYLTAWPSRDIVRLGHEVLTRQWWQDRKSSFETFVSDFVTDEASRGDPKAASERLKALSGIPSLPVTPSAIDLADRLAQALKLPQRARLDAAHVAISAVHRVDYLLTWNCTHLANGALLPKIEAVCRDAGFTSPRILTPQLLMVPP